MKTHVFFSKKKIMLLNYILMYVFTFIKGIFLTNFQTKCKIIFQDEFFWCLHAALTDSSW